MRKVKSNTETDGRYHSHWLNMMYPRLKLAKSLLSDDGVIFISIGSEEQANLKEICDSIFEEMNFITDFIWEKTQHYGRQKVNSYSNYDHILCYAKQLYDQTGQKKELLVEYQKSEFEDAPLYNASNPENKLIFPPASVKFNIPDGKYLSSSDEKYRLVSPVTVMNGLNLNEFAICFRSRWSPAKILKEFQKGTRYWVKTRSFSVRAIYPDGKSFNESPREIIFTNGSLSNVTKSRFGKKVGTNEEGSHDLERLLGNGIFGYPKPTSLIEYLISLIPEGIILDFFSGSSSTADAVMQLNAEDGGSRRHIQVQLPEPVDADSPAGRAGFRTIADIARRRIDLAGEKIRKDFAEQLANRDVPLDVGYRTYKLADTNFVKWRESSATDAIALERHLFELRDSADDGASELALLTEVLLKQGYSLTESVHGETVSGLGVLSVADGLVLAYMNGRVKPTLAQLRALVDREPERLIVLEDAFQGDDELKTNLVQAAKTRRVELWTA